jgi:hypothetical protein
MAVTATKKIIDGQEARFVDGELFEFVDPVIIAGLSPSATLLLDALANPVCPQPYSLFAVGSKLRLVERRATPIDTMTVLVLCTYRRLWIFPDYRYTGSGALETVETSRSSQDPTTWGTSTIQVGPTLRRQCGTIQTTMAQQVLRFERIVESGDPAADQRLYLNKCNSTVWYGLDPGYWLCTKFDFDWLAPAGSITGGDEGVPAWNYVMEFSSKGYGWPPLAEWIDPETGKPHPEPTSAYWQTVDWYSLVNFFDLLIGGA